MTHALVYDGVVFTDSQVTSYITSMMHRGGKMDYIRKQNGKAVTINSWKVTGGESGIVISWESPELGFGEYTIRNHPTQKGKFVVYSECMDDLPDLSFLRSVLGAVVESVIEVRE